MAVKIVIKRKVPREKAPELLPFLKKLRVLAMNQTGYIGGETLQSLDNSDEYLVISTWGTREQWDAWFNNSERKEIQATIDALLGAETEYAAYGYR